MPEHLPQPVAYEAADGDELALLSQVDKNFILNCVDHQVAHCLGYELT